MKNRPLLAISADNLHAQGEAVNKNSPKGSGNPIQARGEAGCVNRPGGEQGNRTPVASASGLRRSENIDKYTAAIVFFLRWSC